MTRLQRLSLVGALLGVAVFAAVVNDVAAMTREGAAALLAALVMAAGLCALVVAAATGRALRFARPVALCLASAPWLADAGLHPADASFITVGWYACGVVVGAALLRMAGRTRLVVVVIGSLVLQTVLWAGPEGLLRLGIAAQIIVVGEAMLLHRQLATARAAVERSAALEREATAAQVQQDAFELEGRQRIERARRAAAPGLQMVLDAHGRVDETLRQACRVLEQTLRDEIRGRRLLSDAVRAAVLAHRRRGAAVQVLDDGGLDRLQVDELAPLLDELAARLDGLRSDRIVIRTGPAESDVAVTVVATSADELSTVLGLDDGVRVDLSLALPRPGRAQGLRGAPPPVRRASPAAALRGSDRVLVPSGGPDA